MSTPTTRTPTGVLARLALARGMMIVVKPRRAHSEMRRSAWAMARTSPARPTSPITAQSAGTADDHGVLPGQVKQLGEIHNKYILSKNNGKKESIKWIFRKLRVTLTPVLNLN